MQDSNSSAIKVALLLSVILLSTGVLYSQSKRAKPQIPAFKRPTPASAQFSISTVCFVPVNGKLRQRKVPSPVVAAQTRALGDRTALLNEVIRQAPHYFPPKARVVAVSQEFEPRSLPESFFRINLNRAFLSSHFWRGRKRQNTRLAFHALARNVAFIHEGKGVPLPVQFVIEGQDVARIGSFQADRILLPQQIITVSR